MGTKVINFRPSADVTVGHSLSGASTAWQCMSEAVADDDATYIYQTVSSTSNATVTTTVNLTGNLDIGNAKDIRINSAKLYVRAYQSSDGTATASVEYTINETTSSGSVDVTTSWTTTEITVDTSLFSTTGEYTIPLTISTTGKKANKASNYQIRITQAYLMVNYTLYNELTVVQGGTGSIEGASPTGLVETPITRTFVVTPAPTTRFVKAFNGETDITSQFKQVVEHHDLSDSDFTITQRSSTTSNGWQKQTNNLTYMSTMTGNSTLYGVTRFALNLPQDIVLNFDISLPLRTADYVYLGKLDTALNTTSQPSTAQYEQRWAGVSSESSTSYSMTIPAGEHFFELCLYHSRNNSERSSTVVFSSTGYDVTKSEVSYTLPETEEATTIRIIFSDYAETYIKKNGAWKRASKVFEKQNGVWTEKTPQTIDIIPQVFNKNFKTEE